MLVDQVVCYLEYVHTKYFIHRNVKSDDFFIGLGKRQSMIHINESGVTKKCHGPGAAPPTLSVAPQNHALQDIPPIITTPTTMETIAASTANRNSPGNEGNGGPNTASNAVTETRSSASDQHYNK